MRLIVLLLSFAVLRLETGGHEQVVHAAITVNAAASALPGNSAFAAFLNSVSPSPTVFQATNALAFGSIREDDIHKDPQGNIDDGGARVLNHFYDPLTSSGLKDFPLGPKTNPYGRSSFTWASVSNGPGIEYGPTSGCAMGNHGTFNKWSWQNARGLEWEGLTAANPDTRIEKMTNMFRAVGQVMHLLEDASQPQHVRDEQHVPYFPLPFPIFSPFCIKLWMPWKSPIEAYGKEHKGVLNYQHGMLDWKAAGFTKMEDFWNRHLYNGNASALADDANGGPKLGLAEYINGNFLGARHLYAELMTATRFEFGYRQSVVTETRKFGYYPYPSLDTSTDYEQQKRHPVAETFTLKDGQEGAGLYIKKIADGIAVAHHSRMNYLGAKLKEAKLFEPRPFCTITDEKVLEEYHSIMITNAIYYSAGLLDYFFRGKLEVRGDTDPGDGYQLRIRNLSGQKFKGGEFRLYWDNDSDTRIRLLADSGNGRFSISWNSSSDTLAHLGTIYMTIVPPTGVTVKQYVLVYQGTIGTSTGNDALDPVEANIAIATESFTELLDGGD